MFNPQDYLTECKSLSLRNIRLEHGWILFDKWGATLTMDSRQDPEQVCLQFYNEGVLDNLEYIFLLKFVQELNKQGSIER
jgi:hypothetical protein